MNAPQQVSSRRSLIVGSVITLLPRSWRERNLHTNFGSTVQPTFSLDSQNQHALMSNPAQGRIGGKAKAKGGVRLNEHLEHDCGLTFLQHACQLRRRFAKRV